MHKESTMKTYLLTGLLLTVSPWVLADIYKYVDENGRVTYSNHPLKGAKRVVASPNSRGINYGAPRAASNPSPANFPKVDRSTQQNRDQSRQRILQNELESEERLLVEARRNLKEAEANKNDPKRDEKIKNLTTEIRVHEKNIEALNTELSKLK